MYNLKSFGNWSQSSHSGVWILSASSYYNSKADEISTLPRGHLKCVNELCIRNLMYVNGYALIYDDRGP